MAEYTLQELTEAKRQLASVLHKTQAVVETLQGKEDPSRYKSQITLAQRRVAAFQLALALLEEKLEARQG